MQYVFKFGVIVSAQLIEEKLIKNETDLQNILMITNSVKDL